MKHLTKIVWIIAGIFAGIGVVCVVIAFAMGLTMNGFKQMIQDGTFSFGSGHNCISSSWEIANEEAMENEENPEDSSGKENVTGDKKVQKFTISESCTNLDVAYGAGVFRLSYADVSEIQITGRNTPDLEVVVEGDTLLIEATVSQNVLGMSDINKRELEIIIPEGMSFDEVELDIGAAQADMDGFLAESIEIVIGAGQANIANVQANMLEIEVGVGQADLTDVDVRELEIEVGMGQLKALVNGAKSDYGYDVECGMGNVSIGNESYGGVAAEHHEENHHADRQIDVYCGMGEVHVNFAK